MTLTESRRIQADQVLRYYGGGWYNMYIQRPRIRYDGVYISTCHYIRSGTSKTTWNQPVHLVTYYRYLRFFTDGTLIKHVTTDEPAQVVKQLDQDYSKQQTFRGHFAWKQDDNGDGKQPMTVLKIDTRDDNLPHERFFLQLDVKGTHRGRHNKLGWRKYTSVNQRHINEYRRQRHDNDPLDALDEDDSMEGLEHVYDLKLMKPYFFSPVRSYRVDYPSDDDDDDGLV
jgi:F-box protein 9